MMDAMCKAVGYQFTTRKLGHRMHIDGRMLGKYMIYILNSGAVSVVGVRGQVGKSRCVYVRNFEREDIPSFVDCMMDTYFYGVDR